MQDVSQKLPNENEQPEIDRPVDDVTNRFEDRTIDLRSVKSLDQLKNDLLRQPAEMQERHRGAIGKMLAFSVALLVLLLPLIGGLIAAFGTASQAQAYTATVVTLLEAVSRFAVAAMFPIMTYYFISSRK